MTTCPACGSDQHDGRKFCEQCGTRLARACRSCGAELSPDARFCGECGTAQAGAPTRAHPGTPPLATVAERKVTSVLFADLVGFTALSETRDKEDVRELLSSYFDECRRIVARYGGTVEKFIGDAVMAVWGVPAAHEDDAERSVRAGLDLVRAVEAIGEDVDLPDLALRVGIVTGEVAVTLGAQHEGMVAGDAVNTASRVQSTAAPGAVWVDENTRLLAAAAITFSDVGSHVLKGKADPVPLWEARAVVAAVGGAQRADGLESPLVGRGREMRLIKELFHGVEETGRPALVVVEGEPGSGKTRLGWEIEKYVDGLSVQVAWHAGRCIGYGEGVAFWPIAEAVRGRLGLLDSDLDADASNAINAGLARYVPDADEAEWLRPRLLVLLGRGAVTSYDRDDLFAAWRTFFERTREDDPAVALMIDDAQHADDGTLEFLEHLLTNSAAPLFVMVMARPGLLERWASIVTNRRSTVLHLAPLQEHEMSELLDGLVSGLPAEIRDSLAERAEGIPLYAMETVRSLIDRDLVVPRGGVYVLADPEQLNLSAIGAPPSLQALVAARLDGLSPDQRRTVQNASVLGTTFTRDALAAVSQGVPDLDAALTSLCRVEMFGTVSSRLSSEFGQYRFVQAVVRQIAYGTLSRRDRKARHVAAAHYFETVPDPGSDLAPVLAQHYLDAVDATNDADEDRVALLDRACEHLRRAATRARSLGSPAEALRYLEVAVEFSADDGAAGLHLDAARAASEAGRADTAVAHGERARELFTADGDPIGAGAAAAVTSWVLGVAKGDASGCLALATPHWESLQGVPGAERVLLDLSQSLISARHALKLPAVDLSEANIAMAEALGDRLALAEALVSFSLSLFRTAPTVTALLLEAAADIATAEQRPALLGRALTNLSALGVAQDLDSSIRHARDALAAGIKSGTSYIVGSGLWNLLLGLTHQGSWDEASDLFTTALDLSQRDVALLIPVADSVISRARGLARTKSWSIDELSSTDDERDLAYLECQRMLAARERGDLPEACELGLTAAERWAAVEGFESDFTFLWQLALEVALEAADRSVLDRLFALVDAIPRGLLPLGLHAHRVHAAGLLAIADRAATEVEAYLRDAIAAFDAWGARAYRARSEADLANWLRSVGRAEDAAPLAETALATLHELGAHGWLAEIGWADRTITGTVAEGRA